MLNKAKGFLANSKGQWFALLGASGSGKTMLCSAVAIELLRQGKELKYMLWKDDSRKIKNDNFDGNGSWFFMGGQSGSGKTHICSAIAIEFLRLGYEVKYMLWKDDSRKIKNDNFEGGNIIEYYKNVDILYIDDLFKTVKVEGQQFQRPTQGDANLAFEIINSRLSQNKITIISSENTIYELFDIDEATAGRIKQMCGEFCLNISKGEGKNYRKRDMI
jgi:DNA replication protein DnaC